MIQIIDKLKNDTRDYEYISKAGVDCFFAGKMSLELQAATLNTATTVTILEKDEKSYLVADDTYLFNAENFTYSKEDLKPTPSQKTCAKKSQSTEATEWHCQV